jgi:predicted acylesterase/phospholipase RssA
MSDALIGRIRSPGPKKILACDGGGILGLMSVEILAKIESDLRQALKRDSTFVLRDYFDFVCGTSTGAIISAAIAAGMSMGQLRDFYVNSGKQMFDPASLLKRFQYKFNSDPLAQMLQQVFQERLGDDTTLGSPGLGTLLMMVMRNATTDSAWPLTNNPFAKYNDRNRPDCNLKLPLWQLVRASTAAPTYFPPEIITFDPGTPQSYSFVFVDGGVTTYNNPAFLAFQMATAAPYNINWATGSGELLLVSIGTGGAARGKADLQASEMNLLYNATAIPGALMNAASAGGDMACRLLGVCRAGGAIDREFGDMIQVGGNKPNFTGAKQFSYLRYDPDVSQKGLAVLGLGNILSVNVQKMDSVDHIDQIQTVGKAFAERRVDVAGHFAGFF